MKTLLLFIKIGLVVMLGRSTAIAADERPNILWISCEDISPHLSCYDDPHAITPNLDQLASEGVRYTRAFTTAGVCAPCRSSIITGCYQNSIGTHHMRCEASLPDSIKPFPMLLKSAGYYCSNNSKTDYQFTVPPAHKIWDESSGSAHWRGRKKDQPFFAVFNFTGCHESGIESETKYRDVTKELTSVERQNAEALTTLPPYYPDTPIVREDWKRNYELITAMDAWAGNLIEQLKQDGLYEKTIIFFWSDHGVGLPRAKRWLYDSGTRIPLVVRIPKQLRTANQASEGTVDGQLVSSVDFAPTVLNLAQLDIPETCQGRAFLGENLTNPRQFVHGARDRMDERYDIIRSVRDQRYRYIRNFEPLKPYYQYMNTPEKGATMREIRQAEQDGTLPVPAQQFSMGSKPIEELYDLDSDPHEINNLANDPGAQSHLLRMRSECLRWQKEIRDLGLVPEAEISLLEKKTGSRFAILRQPGGDDFVERLVEAAAIASEGVEKLPNWLDALADENATVRYWGLTGIGNFANKLPNEVSKTLLPFLEDSSPNVRIAAARALCGLEQTEPGLAALVQELSSSHQWGRLHAAIVLDELDDLARPVLESLQNALHDQPNKYIVRVANKAVNDLLETNNEVP